MMSTMAFMTLRTAGVPPAVRKSMDDYAAMARLL